MPRVKTTRTVRIVLWVLRIYLTILLALIGLKFVRLYRNSPANPNPVALPAARSTTPGP